jgi:hypothetical protein
MKDRQNSAFWQNSGFGEPLARMSVLFSRATTNERMVDWHCAYHHHVNVSHSPFLQT